MVALIFLCGVRHAGDLVLAVHDPLLITIDEAAAPHSSLAFMFWGAGLFVFPLMLLYTAISYSVFRGKVSRRRHIISARRQAIIEPEEQA